MTRAGAPRPGEPRLPVRGTTIAQGASGPAAQGRRGIMAEEDARAVEGIIGGASLGAALWTLIVLWIAA